MSSYRMTVSCAAILTVTLSATVIRAQSPALNEPGSCHDRSMCGLPEELNADYGNCCGDPTRLSFLRDDNLMCIECQQVTCYTEQLNCTGGATNPAIVRPTTIDSCCSNGGVSFDNGVGECINCAVCYLEVDDCSGGTTSDAGRQSMTTCCDTEGGASYSDMNGNCNPCPAMCYSDALCAGSTIGNATTTMDECCNTLSGMAYMTNGQCMQCISVPGAGMDPHFAVPLLNGQDMCYSLQGEPYFAFNLISDPTISINSYFIPPENENSKASTFLGDIGILVQPEECKGHCNPEDITKIAISASDRSVLLGGSRTKLKNRHVKVFVENGTATIKLGNVLRKEDHPSLTVTVAQPPLSFIVQFVNEHLDLIVRNFSGISSSAHGIMGQFLRRPADLTDDGFLIVNGKKICIEKDDAWEFMHTNTKCLHAKPSHGIQADGIIEGKYTDYIMESLFSPHFIYNKFRRGI